MLAVKGDSVDAIGTGKGPYSRMISALVPIFAIGRFSMRSSVDL